MKTTYKTVTFESRLAAQWAVFFDELETAWEYKSREFRLTDGTTYIPTFFIPGWGCFVEPRVAAPEASDAILAEKVSHDIGKQLFYFVGQPDDRWVALMVDLSNKEAEFATGKIYEDRRVPGAFVWSGHDSYTGWLSGIYCPPQGNHNDYAEKYPGELGKVQGALDAALNVIF